LADEFTFRDLLARVRQGDETAAEELVRRYEPYVRRYAREKLKAPELRRELDSLDICQSVLGAFFVRAALGQFQLESPEDLLRLLGVMARNKVGEKARRLRAACRDGRRQLPVPVEELHLSGEEGSPSRIASGRELLEAVRQRLSEPERYLAEQRALGRSWEAIAQELGSQADAVRMRFKRALDRIARELGLEDSP
jgi:RNA polymerase sigma-70 factor (ECF subfamily)